ncbi:FAD-dependent oxidoreductase [Pusillimonas sp. TS35]|nr:FAD-dependent oxidoreductase [Pusillimonas sp. TS35]
MELANVSGSAQTVVIVGAGFSGTMVAVNLLMQPGGSGRRIVLVERHAKPGRGLAYRTWNDNFVLNVPAGNMSARADVPDHFVEYCQSIDPAFNGGSFISRRIYGDYLESTLKQAVAASKETSLESIQGDVVAVRRNGDTAGYEVSLHDGRRIAADKVVLALGHFVPENPAHESGVFQHKGYIANPWDADGLDSIRGDVPVALIGAGHTAVDVVFRLTSNNDVRKIYLISRRGLSLQSHRTHPPPPSLGRLPEFLEGLPPTVRAYCRALRRQAGVVTQSGGDWRDVMNALRQHTPDIWHRFSLGERRRFLSRVVAYWDVHRHRLAPAAHLRLGQMLQSGQVEAVAARVQGFRAQDEDILVDLRERCNGNARALRVGAVVNCIGPSYDISRLDVPVVVQLRDEGYLLQDAAHLGIEVDDRYRVLNSQGVPAHDLFYIGPMLKARYWEAIAVPELRGHVQRLVQGLTAGDWCGTLQAVEHRRDGHTDTVGGC